MSASFLQKSFSPTVLRSKTGVPFEAKKWNPSIGKLPRPGTERGALGTKAFVSGWSAAIWGIEDAVSAERKANEVTSYKVATAPMGTGVAEELAQV